ncbi:hypothetical protein B0T26DRAFT_81322 [Lasiosphaeria miniovina]|uniref:Secreted protein n=1 Tax=Lasiosphaeria miniovina TaxID=1954250 RepID=A0AA40BIC7_9PEZI|nr:uncharacterized protein B0T26DRAFT_81322 [Lasiosphaeria miniovina]KAK0734772.1 hypothetical protein B0T26DRAFT_81322 [Lasiosphaeria miniovina]
MPWLQQAWAVGALILGTRVSDCLPFFSPLVLFQPFTDRAKFAQRLVKADGLQLRLRANPDSTLFLWLYFDLSASSASEDVVALTGPTGPSRRLHITLTRPNWPG